MKRLRIARDGYIVVSVAFYIMGLALLLLPEFPPPLLCGTGGGILAAYGVIKLVGYCSNDLYCLAFQYDLAHGLLLLTVGLLVLLCNLRLKPCLVPGLGLLVLLDGLLTVQTALDARRFGLEQWNLILALSGATGAFGALIIAQPFQSPAPSRALVSCALFSEGILRHFVVKHTVQVSNRRPPR